MKGTPTNYMVCIQCALVFNPDLEDGNCPKCNNPYFTSDATPDNPKRTPIQICEVDGDLTTLCNDGSIWWWHSKWIRIPDIPQDSNDKEGK